ncbi:leucyl aminopeptidase family protein [Nocardioides islandensis]|uniref:leucyl aminopeptidase family protein n=1 Tax=Nocardioides islandensis TaxID=433663 RepID=UPI001E63BE2B|nr:leucyl aminopeptidase family protein [Nocardioides islandensis]
MSGALPHVLTGVDVVALPVLPSSVEDGDVLLGPGADQISAGTGADLLGACEVASATGKAGEVTAVAVPGGTPENPDLTLVLLVGVGDQRPADFRRAGAAMARAAQDRQGVASSIASVGGVEALEPFVVGAMLGSFGFHWRSHGPQHHPVPTVVLADTEADDPTEAALRRAVAIGGAGWRARVLATVPANLKSPEWMAEQARTLGDDTGLKVTVWDEAKLAKEGFGGILGVGRGSDQPSCLIRLDYTPEGASSKTPRVVLVGKGITFDSGGLSIKPADSMTTMKRDMTGGGVVMSVLGALAAVDCPVKVTGLVAAAENAVGADSMRPGDVLRHYGGRTSEVTNTDAEGRLVMADALAYAVDKLDPVAMVDVATLTGSMKVALGQQIAGYFANNEALASAIFEAGEASGEPLWRFPLVRDYEDKLASKIADADNAAGGAGSITAALFLQHFTGKVPWAHLDIASVGDAPEESFEWTAGPTGFGARALLSWLGQPDPLEGIA